MKFFVLKIVTLVLATWAIWAVGIAVIAVAFRLGADAPIALSAYSVFLISAGMFVGGWLWPLEADQ